MRSATTSDGPRLVRIEVPCAQTRVAIGMHPGSNRERHEALRVSRGLLSRPPSLEQSERQDLFFVSRFDIRTEQECRLCSGEFEQLLLTCIEGSGLRSSRFKVSAAQQHVHRDIQLGRCIFCALTVNNSCI